MERNEGDADCAKKKLNPLMLPPVLEVLFEKVEFETLKQTRLVCKLWLVVSKTPFNKAGLLNFYNMYPETYLSLITSIEHGHTYSPLNVALTLSPLYSEFDSIKSLNVCPSHACEEFILPYGESIESLKFYAWDSVTDRLNATLFREILQTPKYLSNLEISLLPVQVLVDPLFQLPWNKRPPLNYVQTLTMYGKLECSQDFLLNFLSAMPNVNSIIVNCCSLDFLDLFTTALHMIPLKMINHIKLNFMGAFLDSQVVNIKKARLPLKTLHIAPRSMITDFQEYYKLLFQVARTLEDVKLTSCTDLRTYTETVSLPVLKRLKILRLQTWRSGPTFWNLQFINQIPNLETLIIERRGLFLPNTTQLEYHHDLLDETNVLLHKNLKTLVLPSVPLQLPHPESLASLFQKFPKLTNLTLSANDTCLRCIFQNLVLIEKLTIAEYSKVTDLGITGLVNEELLFEEANAGCLSQNIYLGITSLKGLKRLEIDGFGGKVTDFSIQYGIKHLKQLKYLILHGCKVSDHGIKMLNKIQLTVVGHDAQHIYEEES